MDTRKKNSNDKWRNVASIPLEDFYNLPSVGQEEFKQDTLSTELKTYNQLDEEKHWQIVKERAAIAAMQAGINQTTSGQFFDALYGKNKYTNYYKDIAKFAVACADALVEELKGE